MRSKFSSLTYLVALRTLILNGAWLHSDRLERPGCRSPDDSGLRAVDMPQLDSQHGKGEQVMMFRKTTQSATFKNGNAIQQTRSSSQFDVAITANGNTGRSQAVGDRLDGSCRLDWSRAPSRSSRRAPSRIRITRPPALSRIWRSTRTIRRTCLPRRSTAASGARDTGDRPFNGIDDNLNFVIDDPDEQPFWETRDGPVCLACDGRHRF